MYVGGVSLVGRFADRRAKIPLTLVPCNIGCMYYYICVMSVEAHMCVYMCALVWISTKLPLQPCISALGLAPEHVQHRMQRYVTVCLEEQ